MTGANQTGANRATRRDVQVIVNRPLATTPKLGAAFCAIVIALAGCGGDDDSDAGSPPDTVDPPTETTHETTGHTTSPGSGDGSGDGPAPGYVETPVATDAPTGESEVGGNEIIISGFAFSGVTEVPVGTTVTIVNQDTATHTWSATDGAFDSEGLAPGDTFEFTFDSVGTYDYRCNLHPSMTGTIVVTP